MARQELCSRPVPRRADRKHVPSVGEIVDGRIVSPVSNTRLVSIGFRSTDPVVAAEVANAIARAYVKWNTEFKSTTTGEASDWLKRQVEEQRRLVHASEAALQSYKKDHDAEALGERQNIVVQKLADVQAAVTRARAETIEKQTQYAAAFGDADRITTRSIRFLPSHPTPISMASRMSWPDFSSSWRRRPSSWANRHPDIIRLRTAVDAADRKLRTEISKLSASIGNEYEAARARESALTAAFERQKVEVQATERESGRVYGARSRGDSQPSCCSTTSNNDRSRSRSRAISRARARACWIRPKCRMRRFCRVKGAIS